MKNIDEFSISNEPLLTIAIPTYNRAKYLDLCLRRISEEIASLSADQRKQVKIYISNNASTDHTVEVISQHRCVNLQELEVVHNTENIGGDRNIVQCYSSAKTPYVWVLGDDDAILPGGLRMVLDVLQEQNIDILYIPCRPYSILNTYRHQTINLFEKTNIVTFENPLTFVRLTNVNLTFISSLVVRTGKYSRMQFKILENSHLSQLGWVFSLLIEGSRFAIIENKMLAAKAANTGGYGLIEVFGNNLQMIANEILKIKPELAHIIQNAVIVDFFPYHIIELRKGDSDFELEKNMSVELKRLFGLNWRYRIFIAPLLSLPLPMAQLYNLLLKVLRRIVRPILI